MVYVASSTNCPFSVPTYYFGCGGDGEVINLGIKESVGFDPLEGVNCFSMQQGPSGSSYEDIDCTIFIEFSGFSTKQAIVRHDFACISTSSSPTSLRGGAGSIGMSSDECNAGTGNHLVGIESFDWARQRFFSDFACSRGEFLQNYEVEACSSTSGCLGRDCITVINPVESVQRPFMLSFDSVRSNPCSSCYQGDRFLSNSENCFASADQIFFSGLTNRDDECLHWQALMYSLCGCPSLPPLRPDPLCNICPDGNEPGLLSADPELPGLTGPFQQPVTCRSINVALSYATNFDAFGTQDNCNDFQIASSENCGCSTPASSPVSPESTTNEDITPSPVSLDSPTNVPPNPDQTNEDITPSSTGYIHLLLTAGIISINLLLLQK